MRNFLCLLVLVAALCATAQEFEEATVTGDRYLGQAGRGAEILLNSQDCMISSSGSDLDYTFQITLQCNGQVQVLWDMAHLDDGESAFDSPRFSLEWAGDRDDDGRLDLVMELSAEASCSKIVVFLSSLSTPDSIVGIDGEPETTCS